MENGTDAGKLTSTYTYVAGGHGTGSTTSLVKNIDQAHIPFEYEYDSRGNIISEKRGDLTTTYAYDALGQLVRVNDPHENATWVYEYDRGGNITSKVRYAYTTGTLGAGLQTISYVYDDSNWRDKLSYYNGVKINYDAIGNLTNDGVWTYTWQAGRQLKQMTKSGMTVDFAYDHNGLRTQKKVTESGVTTTYDYTLHGKLITHMTKRTVDENGAESTEELHFFYDAQSRPAFVEYDGAMYRYIHNLQGDIVAIVDAAGNLVVEYKYDAWGSPISTTGSLKTTLGELSPFRYRGYAFDECSSLYYLRSRYYCSYSCRFLNRDSVIGTWGLLFKHNGYCYARNCPIIAADSNGYESYYILYDGRPDESEGGKGFPIQAEWWEEYLTNQGYCVDKEDFSSVTEFVEDWNNMPEECDYLIIIAHGAEGTLDCNGERLAISYEAGHEYPITHLDTQLNPKTVRQMTILLTCHGATPGYNGISLANIIADKTQSIVYAAKNAKVNYIKGTGVPYLTNSGFWKTLGTILLWGSWVFTFPQKE